MAATATSSPIAPDTTMKGMSSPMLLRRLRAASPLNCGSA
jgi:hypothetical protein